MGFFKKIASFGKFFKVTDKDELVKVASKVDGQLKCACGGRIDPFTNKCKKCGKHS